MRAYIKWWSMMITTPNLFYSIREKSYEPRKRDNRYMVILP